MESSGQITAEELQAALSAPDTLVLQGGRNLTVRAKITLHDGTVVDAAIKRFPAPSRLRALLNRIRRIESKAVRSYRASQFLFEKKRGYTPEPIAVIETGTPKSPGESWFVTRFEPDLVSFKKTLIDLYNRFGPCDAVMDLLRVVAENCARIHDAGFMHRDLGNQNIMLAHEPGQTEPRLLLIDLNRGRLFNGPVTTRARARDISRINLPSDFLRVFLQMYWRGAVPPDSFMRAERFYRRLYALHCATRKIRHPFRKPGPSSDGAYPRPKDLWIWDPRSEQATTTLVSRDRHRHQSLSRITSPLVALVRSFFLFEKNRKFLKLISFERPVISFAERIFVSISADPDRLEKEMSHLTKLGCIGVHIRLYAHEPLTVTDYKIHAVRRLKSMNYAVVVSLVQDREVVTQPAKWTQFCEHVLDKIHDLVMWVEVLHAVNRVKWGIWNFAELEVLLKSISLLTQKYRDVSFIGPSVIDFEWDYLAAALRRIPQTLKFSALSSHLYLDRRGAPEAYQGRYNVLGKLQVLRAMALSTPTVCDHVVISEFNWPLKGTREWSPVGSPYVSPGVRKNDPSVSEEEAAAYTMRYIFIGLCSGLADSMVFWSLAAHGFGLVDPGIHADDDWRERPAFKVLKVFFRMFKHGHYTQAIRRGEGNVWAMKFVSCEGPTIVAAWCSDPSTNAPIPALGFKPAKVIDLYGNAIPIPQYLTGDIVYLIDRM